MTTTFVWTSARFHYELDYTITPKSGLPLEEREEVVAGGRLVQLQIALDNIIEMDSTMWNEIRELDKARFYVTSCVQFDFYNIHGNLHFYPLAWVMMRTMILFANWILPMPRIAKTLCM